MEVHIKYDLCFGESRLASVTRTGADFPNLWGEFRLKESIREDDRLRHVVDYIDYSIRTAPLAEADQQDDARNAEEEKFIDLIDSNQWFLVDEKGQREPILIPIFHSEREIGWRWRMRIVTIRDLLIPAIKEAFPNLPFSFSTSRNLVATLQAPFPEIGELQIYDDGEEATVGISEVTHLHFNPDNATLTGDRRDRQIAEEVMGFLRALFADQVLLFRTPNRGVGGWQRLDVSTKLPALSSDREYFLWSGPYDTHKVT
jgi:hypothetical protein